MATPSHSGFPGGSAGKESARNAGDLGSIPGLGRSPGEGNSCPLQYSGLENPTDCIVHGVTKSRTRLSDARFHFQWSLQLHLLLAGALGHVPCHSELQPPCLQPGLQANSGLSVWPTRPGAVPFPAPTTSAPPASRPGRGLPWGHLPWSP